MSWRRWRPRERRTKATRRSVPVTLTRRWSITAAVCHCSRQSRHITTEHKHVTITLLILLRLSQLLLPPPPVYCHFCFEFLFNRLSLQPLLEVIPVLQQLTLTPTVAIWVAAAMKHPVPDLVKPPSFVIFDIRALWRSGLSIRVPRC